MGAMLSLALLLGSGACPRASAQETRQLTIVDLAAPVLSGSTNDWLNTGGKKLTFEPGRVYIVEFWTFGCINCQRNLPAYARWQKRFANEKVTIIGVHTPETEEEKKSENVIRRVKELGITYPVLLDQAADNWNRWRQEIWPTVLLIDKRGHVRYRWVGELDWRHAGGEEKMAWFINRLLKEE